ncbi:hypothetical protein SI65_07815 [Aspergillus cristatus]|uniref:Uncharacterized protein n=1 Tax=Aspergillus cristatus TaxID=573508 RepID=A0A1E3B7A2_ASPCR|nr:hypothetical protein SI65_07815 [Aspergillus cristatus]
MEDGDYDTNTVALSMNSNNDNDGTNNNGSNNTNGERTGRTRSASTSTSNSNHRRSMSGSLLSKLSFLRTTNQATVASPEQPDQSIPNGRGYDDKSNDVSSGGMSNLRGGKAMASALQQQRRTRRRKGSLRKTALLGTRFESKKMNKGAGGSNNMMDIWRSEDAAKGMSTRPFTNSVSATGGTESMSQSQGSFDRGGRENNTRWGYANAQQRRVSRGSFSRHEPNLARNKVLGDETVTDDEDMVSFTRRDNVENDENNNQKNTAIAAAGLKHNPLTSPSSSSDSYFLQPDSTYGAVHRTKSPLATHNHPADHQEIIWDYSETEWWGWIILIVTWLVFVVGMGSCFGVWSWAWDVGETPYAPPELEDDPTLPIVGYYPALIILTAVMSWVWVVVAWVGMKYFKHANISGEDI